MTRIDALKTFFGAVRPVTNQELIGFRKEDPEGFAALAELAAAALGAIVAPPQVKFESY